MIFLIAFTYTYLIYRSFDLHRPVLISGEIGIKQFPAM